MKLVIVTGMSGAGKTIALKMLEDTGFYCVDNLPIPLIEKFMELIKNSSNGHKQIALGIDIRSGEGLAELTRIFSSWREQSISYDILFLEASNEVLIKRYKETRRSHPLSGAGRVDQGICKERETLMFLKKEADCIIDTSQMLPRELKQELEKIYVDHQSYSNLFVTVLSFGFKYGIPTDADLVFDVRFLPNPFYHETLRPQTGENQAVRDFVMQGGTAEKFLEKLYDMMEFLIPHYVLEGKNQLVVAIGCTGGMHRSVTIAKELHRRLSVHEELGLKIEHRDMEKDNRQKKQR